MVPVTESFRSLNDATVYADVYTEAPNTTGSTINIVNSKTTYPNQNGSDQVGNELGMNKFPSSYANKLSLKSLTKANLKLEYFIGKRLAFPFVEWFVHNNWKKYGLEKVTMVRVCVKFHDIPLVAYTSNGLSLLATKIGTSMMFDSYTNSMCLESWGWSSYARILIEINVCNNFSDHLVMAISNLEGNGYTKETIYIEYEWEPPRCSTCLIFGYSPIDCPKASPTRVVNQKDKGGNNGRTENFKPILVKPKTQNRPKAKQSTGGMSNSLKTTHFVGTNKNSTSGYNKESPSNKGSIFFLLVTHFEALNYENPIIEEVATGSKDTTSGTQEEGQSSTLIVDKIHVIEKHILKVKLVFVDDDRKPLEKIDYPDNLGSDDEVEPVENKIASFLASKPMGVGYGPKSLLEQWREMMWMMTTTHMMMICMKVGKSLTVYKLHVIIWM
ncbi:chalcone--flavonone isomerase [Tanacetum coccineum]